MQHLTNPAELSNLLAAWGYLGIFILVFVGNLGVPVPEESVLITAGFLASHGLLDLECHRYPAQPIRPSGVSATAKSGL